MIWQLALFCLREVVGLLAAGAPHQLANGFSLGRTYPAEVGTLEATVWCAASTPIQSRTCEMTTPAGLILTLDLDSGSVVSGTDEMTGYLASSDPTGRVCAITIAATVEADLGEWKCKIQPEDGGHFQEGIISLLTSEQGFVRDMRLPKHVVPYAYNLSLTPFIVPNNYTIQGSMDMAATIQEAENKCENKCVVLHSLETEILEDSVELMLDGFPLELAGVGYDYDREFLILYTVQDLTPGLNLTLHIEFISILNDYLSGFYRSSYWDPLTNTTKTIATTQFESTDSRRAFPSLDEPAMKAVFTVSLGRRPDMISLSNMQLVNTTPHPGGEGYVVDHYEPTVKMSTYLLAFIVCEFKSTYAEGHENFKIWAAADRISDLAYAAEIGPKITEYYGQLFDVAFPLAKMDMAAIPDFQSGAMENWGLITYRDSNLFYNEKDFAESNRMRVSVVVAHELAHQWFGDLVTMKWWTDLWLNEGFASFVEYIGTDFVAPEMVIRQQAVNIDLHDVFYLDSLPSSHPISTVIDNPTFQDNFDRISYGKGSVLLRMMEDFLTSDSFFAALANYFKKYAYSNAEQDDLWQAFDDQAHADGVLPEEANVKTIMDTWTLLKGYPVLNVRRVSNTTWSISQAKFNLEVGTEEDPASVWWVPVTYKNVDQPEKTTFWLSEKAMEVAAPASLEENAFVFNVDQMGYYRVNYDDATWLQLTSSISSLSNINRAGLVDDALNLARAGQLGYAAAMEVTKALTNETDYITLTALNTALKFLDRMLRYEEEFYPFFQAHSLKIIQAAYDMVSLESSTDFLAVVTRSLVMGWSCYLGLADCRQRADQLFQAWKLAEDYESSVDPNDKPWVLCSGIRGGNEVDWELAWSRLQTTQVLSERFALYSALACTSDPQLINRYLERSIDPASTIRNQDMRYVYTAIGESEGRGGHLMLTWLEDNYDAIRAHYADTFVYNVKNMLLGFPEEAVTTADYERLVAFLTGHRADLGSAVVTIEQGLNKIAANIKWRENFFDDVTGWLTTSWKLRSNGGADRSGSVLMLSMMTALYWNIRHLFFV